MTLYHILNRGVEKRNIFLDNQDYFRFIHDLFEFNDQERVDNVFRRFQQKNDLRGRSDTDIIKKRKPLVKIHSFCLMKNHFHFLLSEEIERGISKFMNKVCAGYVKYFNIKHKRVGPLFQGRFKRLPIKNESHFLHIVYYIHLNPLDSFAPEWRERRLNNYNKAIKFVDKYRWSSHSDYRGVKNFPLVTHREFMLEFFDGEEGYKKSIKDWLTNLNSEQLVGITLDE